MKKRYRILAKVFNKQHFCIGAATNSYTKSHPLQKHFAKLAEQPNKIYLHAEILALIRASANPNAKIHSIEIEQWDMNGYKDAKPCPICIEAIIAFGIKTVNYTTKNGWVYGKTPQELKDEYSKSK